MKEAVQAKVVKQSGDLVSLVRPLNATLSSHNSKLRIRTNLPPLAGRRVGLGLLELIVEAGRVRPEWKLKFGEVSITREFKPQCFISLPEANKVLYKFIYDVTSILNARLAESRESLDLTVKYEGGEPFRVLGVLLDAIYEDTDAQIKYWHFTGMSLVSSNERVEVDLGEVFESGSNLRLVTYGRSPAELNIHVESHQEKIPVSALVLDEHNIKLPGNTQKIGFSLSGKQAASTVIASLTVYMSEVKKPALSICGVEYAIEGSELKLVLSICNESEFVPDKLVLSILRSGELLYTTQELSKPAPKSSITREIKIPLQVLRSRGVSGQQLTIRLIWYKLARMWIADRVVRVELT